MTKPFKPCIDCVAEGITSKRKAPYPGPRCATHNRAKRSQRKSKSAETRWMSVYGITAAMYWLIYKFQGGKCYICRRATGARKRLSVDHCHKTGYVRGLLCQKCNRDVLGHLRDDPEALQRAIDYLNNYPAWQAGVVVITPDMRPADEGAA
ncbi:endonuclease VII [Mycobacterium phage Anthony]|uniref:HNH endonuclease n=1 Tax=Mycobacterium phage Anthony TaxID=2599857 RepID=A0A5J6TK88_9CAUD|nr:endonuclease VII [Mycobacterium phage Anthony]QFG10434.1 HNH endonuclease [Mycobacterium phage Anthony]